MAKIVTAVIACNHKAYSLERVINNNLALESPPGVELLHYVNLELGPAHAMRPEVGPVYTCRDGFTLDIWHWETSWREGRRRDQDEGYRLPRICMGYNMAVEYARHQQADAILHIDSDVVVPQNSAVELWDVFQRHAEINVISGLVPGRGCHSHVQYTGSTGLKNSGLEPWLKFTDYATCGFVMVRHPVFWSIPWRWGRVPGDLTLHSVDPLFGHDTRQLGFGPWYVHTRLLAEHLDDPERPLTSKETSHWCGRE